jgi:hypothetical protein
MIRTLSTTALNLIFLTPCAMAQVTASAEMGYDDNPFRLSDQFEQSPGAFAEGALRLEHSSDSGVFFDLRGTHLVHENDNANRTSYRATLGYEVETMTAGRPATLMAHIRVTGSDRTFISRNTGEIGQFSGSPIPDRFDYNGIEARTRNCQMPGPCDCREI